MHPTQSPGDGTNASRNAANVAQFPKGNHGAMKRVAILAISVLLATVAAIGFLAADQESASAAGGKVNRCGGGRIFLDAKEKRTFALHNEIRRKHHLPTFCVHPTLEKAARDHSQDMIRRDYFSHNTKGRNETAEKRIKRFGYTPQGYSFYMIGENIAYGSGSYGEPDSIMNSWMKSDEHRHNILNGKYREIGIGVSTGTWQGHDGVSMYTADFGVRRR
ncbi:MAG TPA: CAP domain-containing protein [Rubrobacter sp.]|nr:CAP domain-containing protein [Rubrobacter sp.]